MTPPTEHEVEAWQPVHIDNAVELERLVKTRGLSVVDTIARQRHDLARLLPPPNADLLNEPTRWYYYPWRRSVVHLLGPHTFQTLRSDRNRHKLTTEEQQRLREFSVGVIGLSAGHSIAHTLALEGVGHLRLADFDEVELSNLNRLPGSVFDLGHNKAIVIARRIAELDPYIDLEIDPKGVTDDSVERFMEGLNVVIEECDSFDVKLMVREAARRHHIPVIMETNDRGLLDIERFDLEPERPILHGLLGNAKPAELVGLSVRDKVPHVLKILEADQLSARVVSSMIEIDRTVSTWPQLGGDIQLGAATVAAAVRRLALTHPLESGRIRIDLHDALDSVKEPALTPAVPAADPPPIDPDMPPADSRRSVIHAARLAPSGGNTQPWLLTLDNPGLRIELDPNQTSTLDLAFRGSYVAIGAALFNARVAAARHGILGPVATFPNGTGTSPVATVALEPGGDDELGSMYDAMLQRVSNRHVTEPLPLAGDVVSELRKAAHREGAEVSVVTNRSRLRELGALFGESDRIRFLTEHLHREMMRELRWPGIHDLTWGLDVRTLELDSSDLAKLQVAQRGDVMAELAELDLGQALAESSRARIEHTSALVVVMIEGSRPADYVRGGQAVQRVWIRAEQLGLSVHVMSPVFIYATTNAEYDQLSPTYADQLRRLRQDFAHLTDIGGHNIALTMRIGYAPTISARSRRRPDDRIVRTT
ncbi:Rv1355c family protein [Phytoactinopolyspora limicola]|uniref:Rv1355c family protein n=1 Tax=Phytoactinopolyspora limicola TaxID=2715536 RepID=UPI00140760AE|nr:Rv1355c family protein [Phytoactinopolyspora limicola]